MHRLVDQAYAAAKPYGKRVIAQEFGSSKSDAGQRAEDIKGQITDLIGQCCPYTPWELAKPGSSGGDFEYWTNQQIWTDAILPLALSTPKSWCGQCWPEIWGGSC